MLRAWCSRLISAGSILLIGMGGGSLPVVDELLFHSRGSAQESTRAHFEATSGCHADGCAVSSTAQQAGFAPALGTPVRRELSPELAALPPGLPPLLSKAPIGQPLSRAPPYFG